MSVYPEVRGSKPRFAKDFFLTMFFIEKMSKEEWEKLEIFYVEQLKKVRENLKDFSKDGKKYLSKKEIENILLSYASNESKNKQKAWKNVVERGIYENAKIILDGSYYFLTHSQDDDAPLIKRIQRLGSVEDVSWQYFVLKVILHAREYDEKHFDLGFETYEDTAGGCDENISEAAFKVLEKEEIEEK